MDLDLNTVTARGLWAAIAVLLPTITAGCVVPEANLEGYTFECVQASVCSQGYVCGGEGMCAPEGAEEHQDRVADPDDKPAGEVGGDGNAAGDVCDPDGDPDFFCFEVT